MWGRLAEFVLQSHCLFTDYFLGEITVQYRSRNKKKIAVYFRELQGKNLKNVSEGCLAMSIKRNRLKDF